MVVSSLNQPSSVSPSVLQFPVLAAARTAGPAATLVAGLTLLVLAFLNYRYVETLTRFTLGRERAARLAESPIGNKIGGTIFLVVVGVALSIAGAARLL